jgi:L-asparaginase
MKPILIIHGGLSPFNDDTLQDKQQKMSSILEQSYQQLLKSTAMEAVILAVKLMEDEDVFNAGYGSDLQADGEARLSASLINGSDNQFSGLVNIEHIKNPILVTRYLMAEKDKVLSGQYGLKYALSKGFKKENVKSERSIKRWKEKAQMKTDTVGACALDLHGHIASAVSTGGVGGETPGRVSDSPTPGGNYANDACAVVTSGMGQQIINECVAAKIVVRRTDGQSLETAFKNTFSKIRQEHLEIGAIGVDHKGNIGWDEVGGILAFAYKTPQKEKIFSFKEKQS